MKNTRTKLLAAVLSVALLASVGTTGCSKKASAQGSTSSEGATYKIGVGMPITQGATALGEGITRAAELAVAQANESERAKALGVKFEVLSGDDLGDPKTGVNVANMFVGDPQLVGVMGHLNSGVCMPASKVYSDNNIVMVAPAATNPDLTLQGLKNVFRLSTIDTVQGEFAADAAVNKLGFKTAFVVDDSTPYGEGLAARFGEVFAQKGGKVVGTDKTTDKDTDFNALATKIKAANPDVVYFGGVYNAGALFAKQLADAGCTARFMGGDGLKDAEFVKLAGAPSEGALSTSVGLPLDKLPAGADFLKAYEAKFPGKPVSAYDAYGYDSTNVVIDAVLGTAEKMGAGKVTTPAGRAAVISAVAATKTDGVTGAIQFDERGDTLNKVITLYVVKNGEWVAYE